MKKLPLLVASLAFSTLVFAAEPAKAPEAAKPKSGPKPDPELCCDDDAAPADSKTAKPDAKNATAKKEAGKPAAKPEKK
jgi:hypothetical protein